MVQINFAQKTVNVKIVYYGPGMSGKTTNLEVVHQRAPEVNRGELTSISTDGDRTLFFDYMPLELGTVAGMRTCFQLYTVPGQVYYNSTRKLVLQGVDGVIFVADSGEGMLEQNIESLRNLEENLNEYGKSLATLPHVIQWNKRDLPNAMSVGELEQHMNHHGAPTFEAVANTGQGVFPTLKALAASVLKGIMQETGGKGAAGAAPKPASATPSATSSPAAPATPSVASAPSAPKESAPRLTTAPPTPAGAQLDTVQVATAKSAPALAKKSASAGELMRQSKASAPSAKPRARQASKGAAASRRSRPQRPAAQTKPVQRQGVSAGVFVAVAAGIGAAIAWAAMNFMA